MTDPGVDSVPGAPAASHTLGGQRSTLLRRVGLDLEADALELALTHRSYAYEHGGLPTNERLEFLGGSVLGIVITDQLYRDHPDLPEGQLAKLRASIVNMHALAAVGASLGLGDLLLLGRGEELTGGRSKASIVSDAVEALLGALYLQHGLEPVRAVVLRLFHDLLIAAPRLGAGLDWKTSLQELSASTGAGVPVYTVDESGPDHDKTFTARASVGGEVLGAGTGHTKKQAEQLAAAQAYRAILDGDTASGTAVDDSADPDAADLDAADAVAERRAGAS